MSEDDFLHYKEILFAISQIPEEAEVEEILNVLQHAISRRNLQRCLSALIQAKKIARSGKGRATRYKVLIPLAEERKQILYEEYIPISEDSRLVLEYIRRPKVGREPIGYQREFLAAYEPNKTWYLGESTRSYLKQLGDTGEIPRPAGTYGRAILSQLLIDLSWASSGLEGNTYSRLDTQKLIELGESAEGKNLQETQMILNHKAAISFIVEDIDHIDFNIFTLLSLHGLLSENLLADLSACGRLRSRPVNIYGSVYKPIAIPQVIEESCREILHKVREINDPFEQAFFIMVHIPYLQPFEDVNKRVSRLLMNVPLLKGNFCPLTFIDVPERAYVESMLGVYEMARIPLLRDLFIWAYERSTKEYLAVRKTLAEPDLIRLRYRQKIHALIGHIVRDCVIETMPEILRFSEATIPIDDQPRFIEIILDDLKRLHEGVLARYQLWPSDLAAWQAARQKVKKEI